MTEHKVIGTIFDRYSLVARVYPALLVLAPLAWSAAVLFPALVSDYGKGIASMLALGSLLYFVASLARSRGKLVEQELLEQWGGWPTTLLLRHRDDAIDPVTKGRYHHNLAAIIGGRSLPTPEEEVCAPEQADDFYRSATKRLIEVRRGPHFQLVENENASYGFRRNLFGLKWVALGFALTASLAVVIVWWTLVPEPLNAVSVETSLRRHPHLFLLAAANFGYAAILLLVVNKPFVRQAADEYALALLRTLDHG